MHGVACLVALSSLFAVHAAAQPARQTAGFIGLDIFGGYATHGYGTADDAADNGDEGFNGWDVGASFRPRPWIGITGTIGRTWLGDTRVMHYLAGPRFTTSYGGNYYGIRLFTHVLAGVGSVSTKGLPAESGLEIAAGAGADVWYVIHVQADYLRLPDAQRASTATPFRQHQVRLIVGGVIPFCFRECRPHDEDGIDLSK